MRDSNKLIRGMHYPVEVFRELKEGEILNLILDLTDECNFECLYCATRGYEPPPIHPLDLEERQRVIQEAAQIGAKVVYFCGEGEPTLDPDFIHLVALNNSLGLTTILYTNMTQIDERLAHQLHESDVSLVLKLDTFREEVHKQLHHADLWQTHIQGLDRIKKVYGKQPYDKPPRLEVSTVLTNFNREDAPAIRAFCDEYGIIYCCKTPGRKGLAKQNWNGLVGPNAVELEEIARKYTDKVQTTGNIEGVCLISAYGAVINRFGIMFPCPSIKDHIVGNVRKTSLKELVLRRQTIYLAPGPGGCLAKYYFNEGKPIER